jgi:hypothetical protein
MKKASKWKHDASKYVLLVYCSILPLFFGSTRHSVTGSFLEYKIENIEANSTRVRNEFGVLFFFCINVFERFKHQLASEIEYKSAG